MNTTMQSQVLSEMDELQQSWGSASALCFVNFIAGLMVAAFTGYSALTIVPIFVSATGTVANAIYCFTAVGFMANGVSHGATPSKTQTLRGYVAASFLADMLWLVSQSSLLPLRTHPREECTWIS